MCILTLTLTLTIKFTGIGVRIVRVKALFQETPQL